MGRGLLPAELRSHLDDTAAGKYCRQSSQRVIHGLVRRSTDNGVLSSILTRQIHRCGVDQAYAPSGPSVNAGRNPGDDGIRSEPNTQE